MTAQVMSWQSLSRARTQHGMLRFGGHLILDIVDRERWTADRGAEGFMMMQFLRIDSSSKVKDCNPGGTLVS